MGNLGTSSKGNIPIGAGLYYHCLGIQEMKAVNSTFLRKTSDHLYSTKSALNTYREEEVLAHINQNYSVIWNAKGKYYPIYHFIKDGCSSIIQNLRTSVDFSNAPKFPVYLDISTILYTTV